jgi:hypothetical protein
VTVSLSPVWVRARHRPARRSGSIPVLILACLVCGVLAGAWIAHPSPYSPPVEPGLTTGGSSGSVRLVNASTPLTWIDDAPAATVVTIENVTSSDTDARVWWFLGRIDDPSPWRDPIATSQIASSALRSHEELTLKIPPATPAEFVPPGTYVLSLWVHVLDRASQTYVHSDGRSLKSEISVVPVAPYDVRRFNPGRDLMISEAHLIRSPIPRAPGVIEVTVANLTTTVQAAAVWSFVAPPGTAYPWKDPEAEQSKSVQTVIGPGASVSMDVPAVWDRRGLGKVSIWVHRLTTSSSLHEDGIWLRRPVG